MVISRLILYFITCALLTSCAFKQNPTTIKTQYLAKPHKIASSLEDWNNKQTIRLQHHQLVPIDYLEKNPKIKGLVINHYLGTGKTYLAIGFAEKHPNRPVIILAPSFLQSHWLEHLEKYGVSNKDRYRFFSHNAPEALVKEDLSNAILILDESHRFIERVRSQNPNSNLYSSLYFNLRKSHRILALTGTPIYNDIFDLIYQINLVSGKNIFPFNQEEFRVNFSKINTLNAYWRGHLLESLYLPRIATFTLTTFSLTYFSLHPLLGFLVMLASPFIPDMLKELTPVDQYPIREFHPEKLKAIINQYISYYSFDHDTRFYPKQSSYEEGLSYNQAQLDFLYKFYDSRLNDAELTQILKDVPTFGPNISANSHNKNIYLNSSLVQNAYKITPGAGREIGNLFFIEASGGNNPTQKIIFPAKFKHILSKIEGSHGPVVIYSHYYHNGLLLFKQFLDASGYKEKYRIFHPTISKDQHAHIINEFNNNKIKILLLHPDITEGISLKGTRQLHFLDVPINSAMKQQIIGRAIRYRSHLHLPENEQYVEIYTWKYHLKDLKANIALRENWHHNFAALNYYSDFGSGRTKIDKNAKLKDQSPDINAYIHLNTLNRQMETLREYLKVFSIENSTYHQAK